MKRILKSILVITLCVMILGLTATSAAASNFEFARFLGENNSEEVNFIEKSNSHNLYTIDAELNTEKKELTVKQTVKYINNEDIDLKEIYFHVYANAFKTKETAPFLFDSFNNAYPRGFESGFTEITSIKHKSRVSKKLAYSFQGEGDTILKVKLPITLKPGKSIEIEMEYVVHIPPAGERFGYGDNSFNLGNWYPIAAVYDERDGWNLDKYYAIGDPFYSDTSDYIVSIKAPSDYVIASSGMLTSEVDDKGHKTWTFEANSMRDFAFIANNNFMVAEKNVEGTIVKSYYYKNHSDRGKKALEIGEKSIKLFNAKYGKYPYPTYSIVETEFPSGMEYPGLVYISDNYYTRFSSFEWFTVVIVHETAHQWWYSLVGNDQIDEAWLDEGFATYSEKIYDEEYISKAFADSKYLKRTQLVNNGYRNSTVVRPLDQFMGWGDYGPIAYSKGSVVLNELRKEVGEEMFFAILQAYFEEYRFKIATTEDFIAVCEEVSEKELDDFFDDWLYAKPKKN